jgi:hypothetical protein
MNKRFRGRWMLGAMLMLAGCGSSDTTGPGTGRGPGNIPLPAAGKGSQSTGSSGSGVLPIDNPNATGPDQAHTMPKMIEMPCASTSIVANRVLPTVMLVVDGSTSMEMPYGSLESGDGGMPVDAGATAVSNLTRWQAVREALVKPGVGVVPSLEGLVRFGMAVFGTNATCPLPLGTIPPELKNYAKINAGLPANPPGMFTPTGPALDMVADLLEDPTLAVDRVVGPQIVVLATDGEPNACNVDIFTGIVTDYAPSIAAAMKISKKHLKMYVVSVADAAGEFANHLQDMANIGQNMPQTMRPGAEVYYPANPAALAETLKTLIGAELSCDLALEGKGVKMGLECMGTVMLNGQNLECNGADGWSLVDETHIRLNGTACDMFKDAVDAKLSANFPCQVILTI